MAREEIQNELHKREEANNAKEIRSRTSYQPKQKPIVRVQPVEIVGNHLLE